MSTVDPSAKDAQALIGCSVATTADGASDESQGDTLVFAGRTEGASAGASLTGGMLPPADGFNKAYYGKVVTARDLFERKEVYKAGRAEAGFACHAKRQSAKRRVKERWHGFIS